MENTLANKGKKWSIDEVSKLKRLMNEIFNYNRFFISSFWNMS